MSNKKPKRIFIKESPTFLPAGFGLKKSNDIIIIELTDEVKSRNDGTEEIKIISSFALTSEKAKEFAEAINEAINVKKAKR
jgi:hypothetical protein